MKLLVSAFRKECTAHANAANTAALLLRLVATGYTCELCFGMYKGTREITVQVTGFRILEDALSTARTVLRTFKQECALLITEGVASTVGADSVTVIGPAIFAANQPDCDGHTQYMDGLYLYARQQIV